MPTSAHPNDLLNPCILHMFPTLSHLQGINASWIGMVTCKKIIRLKYDNEMGSSLCTTHSSTSIRVLDQPWYCDDSLRAGRELWSDVHDCPVYFFGERWC